MKTNEIPANIGEYLKYDETSPSCLRWIKKLGYKINIGDVAGRLNNRNYYQTCFDGKDYKNHRIIFFLHYGYCPDCIDHINTDRTNNKINNLREATRSDNNCNSKIRKNNTSGHKNVSLQSGKYWRVQINKFETIVVSKLFPLDQFQQACDYSDEQRQIIHGNFARK